jgi:hypothetical protein
MWITTQTPSGFLTQAPPLLAFPNFKEYYILKRGFAQGFADPRAEKCHIVGGSKYGNSHAS